VVFRLGDLAIDGFGLAQVGGREEEVGECRECDQPEGTDQDGDFDPHHLLWIALAPPQGDDDTGSHQQPEPGIVLDHDPQLAEQAGVSIAPEHKRQERRDGNQTGRLLRTQFGFCHRLPLQAFLGLLRCYACG